MSIRYTEEEIDAGLSGMRRKQKSFQLTSWLVEKGYAQSERQANMVFLYIAVGIFLASLVFFYIDFSSTSAQPHIRREGKIIPIPN